MLSGITGASLTKPKIPHWLKKLYIKDNKQYYFIISLFKKLNNKKTTKKNKQCLRSEILQSNRQNARVLIASSKLSKFLSWWGYIFMQLNSEEMKGVRTKFWIVNLIFRLWRWIGHAEERR